MAQKIEDLILQLVFDDKDASARIGRFDGKMKDLQHQAKRSGQSISQGFTAAKYGIMAAVAAIGTLAAVMNKSIQQASKYQEANSKMLTVFKDMQGEARSMRDELVKSYNMSTTAATELLAATGDILTGFGIQQQEALNLSGQVQRLSADLASFTNAQGGAKAVSDALTKAMLGERESLKTYGIAIMEADVKQKLYEKGQDKLTGAALRQAKAQATLEIAMSQSKNAIGDLERTQHSFANTQRRLGNTIEDMSLKFGAVFIPIATRVLQWFSDLVNKIPIDEVVGTLGALFAVFKDFAQRIWTIFESVGNALAYLLAGDFEQVGNEMDKLWGAITEGWHKTAEKITAEYHDAQDEFDAFMKGSVDSHAGAMQQIQEQEIEEQKAREERLKNEKKAREDYYENEKKMHESYREMRAEWAAEDLEKEDEKLDIMYQVGQLQYNQYRKVLDDRLNHAKLIYGQESIEYLKLIQQKKQLDDDYKKAKDEQDKKLVEAYTNIAGGMLTAAFNANSGMFQMGKDMATAQAIISAIQAASTTLAHYPFPFNIPLAAAALAQGYINVSKIRSQRYAPRKYARGGLIDQPTMALMGESGAEVVAPKRDFIQVVNNMITKGEVGVPAQTDNSVMIRRLDGLEKAIRDTRITKINIDGMEIARAVERGQTKVNTGKITY